MFVYCDLPVESGPDAASTVVADHILHLHAKVDANVLRTITDIEIRQLT